jgi:serine/threonine-protein kinase RsbW
MNGSIKIPSDMSNIYRAENFIDKIAEKYNFGDELIGEISVSVIEAVSNAIQHGNKNDITKIVLLEYVKDDNKIVFSIQDEGDGFDLKAVADPTLPENIENIKGRGLFLINHLADKVIFENNGSVIKIEFNI